MNKQQLLVVALLVSLGVNLLIAGVVIGRAGKGPRPPVGPPPMEWVARELPPETKRVVMQEMRARQADFKPLRSELRTATQAVRRAITASDEDYDPQALAAALKEVRRVSIRYQELIHESLVGVTADMPRAQRIAVARAALARAQQGQMPQRPAPDER